MSATVCSPARVATGGLLAVFALPSCFTTSLWRQQAEYRTESSVTAAQVRVDPQAGTMALQPLAADREWLRRFVPGIGDATPWLLVEPQEHGATVGNLLEVIAARSASAARSPVLALSFREPLPAGEDRCVIESWLGSTYVDDGAREVQSMPGVLEGGGGIYGLSYSLRVAARVRAVPSPPPDLQPWAAGGLDITEVRQTYEPPGTGIRLLLTPPALALDLVLSPFELLGLPLWW
jgi:hypothetical protein